MDQKDIFKKYGIDFVRKKHKPHGPRLTEKLKCKTCSTDFVGKQPAKYCSYACNPNASKNKYITFIQCSTCFKEIPYRPIAKYCSPTCRKPTAPTKGPNFITKLHNCLQCNKLFGIKNKKARFCSNECWKNNVHPKKERKEPKLLWRIKKVKLCICGKSIKLNSTKCKECNKYKPTVKICPTCNISFETKQANSRVYCKPGHNPKVRESRKRNKWVKRFGQKISRYFKKTIIEIYLNRPKGYEVDHIIPLNHPDVCGLHVPWNFQYLSREENNRKNNKLPDSIISQID